MIGEKQVTATGYFKASATERVKVLLYDLYNTSGNSFNYSVSIEKIDIPDYKTQLVYQEIKLDEEKKGKLKLITDPGPDYYGEDWQDFILGEGFHFKGDPNKSYNVTVEITPTTYGYICAGFYILRDDGKGYNFDYRQVNCGDDSKIVEIGGFDGEVRILLFGRGEYSSTKFNHEFDYSIIVKEDGDISDDEI
ncbi:MAG: hypothetical protein LBU89_08305, partial [Fibromonadaceae bacterium]|nr:hypothetical protein [Fibromonadaceae bacterium]